ncbi:IS66 family insertion sequence element accessory protein TnpA [Flavobacterium sp. SM2513]|uniref:IS66 family insertion sequence element accessory protein TnpA n=1 Tax=Flavobacterium sp. SM2513 TaxID=3424766 RepID=UPI003D7F5C4F
MNQQEQLYTLVVRWWESGLAKSIFCKEQQISFRLFNHWLKKFHKDTNTERSKPDFSFFSLRKIRKKIKNSPLIHSQIAKQRKSSCLEELALRFTDAWLELAGSLLHVLHFGGYVKRF